MYCSAGSRQGRGLESEAIQRALAAAFEMQARDDFLAWIAAFAHARCTERIETEPLRQQFFIECRVEPNESGIDIGPPCTLAGHVGRIRCEHLR